MVPARHAPDAVGARSSFSPPPWLAAAVILVAALLAYANSFGVPFIFDDEASIVTNPTLRDLTHAWSPPRDGGLTVSGRPLLNVSLALNHALGGTDVRGYHALNLLIHTVAALALFGVIRRTLLTPLLAARFGSHASLLTLFVALLWAVHPLQTESVTYVIQRAESLMGLCYLLTFWFFLRSRTAGASRIWSALAFSACLAGMATKEVMVTAPVMLFLYDRTFIAGSWRAAWAQRRGFYLALATTWLVLLTLVWSTAGRGGSAGFGLAISPLAYALTQFGAIAHYLALIVWPRSLVLDYGPSLAHGWQEILLPALLVVSLLAVSVRAAWRGSPAGFCGVFFFAVLAPSSSVVPIAAQTLAEHRLYLPLASALAVLVLGTYRLLGAKSFPVASALVLAALALSVRRNQDYATVTRIYEDTVAKRPGNANAAARLADHYHRLGEREKSRDEFLRALSIEPNAPRVLNNLGSVYLELRDPVAAVASFQKALARQPNDAATQGNLGNALIFAGRFDDGIAQLDVALRAAPQSWEARANLANALAQANRFPEAAPHFEQLVLARPDDPELHNRYGHVLLTLGRLPQAIEQWTAAVRLQPANPELHNRLGVALVRAGQPREALAQFEEVLRLSPANASARQNADRTRQLLNSR